jgi:hypothetical protein
MAHRPCLSGQELRFAKVTVSTVRLAMLGISSAVRPAVVLRPASVGALPMHLRSVHVHCYTIRRCVFACTITAGGMEALLALPHIA